MSRKDLAAYEPGVDWAGLFDDSGYVNIEMIDVNHDTALFANIPFLHPQPDLLSRRQWSTIRKGAIAPFPLGREK